MNSGEHASTIKALDDAVAKAETDLLWAVRRARRDGESWAAIGTSLGVTRQAAQKKYAPHMLP